MGLFHRSLPMLISEGYFYHISDSFFQLAADGTLMSNYENGHYRPHFLAVKDPKNSAIFWMIPVSSRYAKFQGIYDKQVKKYGRCTKIVLGNCGGKDAAFLIQNAFPVTADFFDHIHTSQGQPLTLHEGTAKTIVSNLHNNLKLHRRGIRLFFADIDRIYHLMEEHLASVDANAQATNRNQPVAIGNIIRQKLDEELQKGIDSLNSGSFTADEVDKILNGEKSKT